MRNKKTFLLILTFLISSCLLTIKAQDKNAGEVKKIVESKNYIFKAQSASPQTGSIRQLTSDYDLTISGSKVISYLPYFGRAYTAPIDPSEGGIKFTSTNFEYTAAKNSKGWEIMIRPKDAPEVQQLYLNVYDNGTASLNVISTNRQSISFNGNIKEGKAEQKKGF